MAMSKKHYQALAGAMYAVRPTCDEKGPHDCNTAVSREQWEFDVQAVARVLAQDASTFDRERFLEACKTGKTRGMKQVTR